jgi:purine-binding chemotaxis protein CheW
MQLSKKAKIDRGGVGAETLPQLRQAVCFYLNGVEYGIDVNGVEEIIRMREIRTGGDWPSSVRGTIGWREQEIPVIDMRLKMGYEAADDEAEMRLVVINYKGRTAAVMVDSITEVLRIESSGVTEVPDDEIRSVGEYLQGIYIEDENQLRLLDVPRLLGDIRFAAVRQD